VIKESNILKGIFSFFGANRYRGSTVTCPGRSPVFRWAVFAFTQLLFAVLSLSLKIHQHQETTSQQAAEKNTDTSTFGSHMQYSHTLGQYCQSLIIFQIPMARHDLDECRTGHF
jgi:hypothetical protein